MLDMNEVELALTRLEYNAPLSERDAEVLQMLSIVLDDITLELADTDSSYAGASYVLEATS